MFIDTHSHLDFDTYDEDRELVIQRAITARVMAMITIGTDLESSRQAVLLAEKYAAVYAAVGIHPTDCATSTDLDFEHIRSLASHDKVVAIGEVGLDYHHMRAPKDVQKNAFSYQIQLALELNLPLIIHNRESHDDMLKMIKDHGIAEAGAVMHSFSGDEIFLEEILNAGLYLSFTGNITFKKSTSDELVRKTPLECLLLETDSPFLTPVPLRGKRNEPALVIHTANKIAELKNISADQLGRVTSENAQRLFSKMNL